MKLLIFAVIGLLIFILIKFYNKWRILKIIKKEVKYFGRPRTTFTEILEIDKPVNFGYNNVWFSVKSTDKEEIAKLLKLNILGKSNWKEGIKHANDNRTFITPEINGWTLIVGNLSFFYGQEGFGSEFCNKLSAKFGEAQFFFTKRPETHIWCKSINGQLIRYYSYSRQFGIMRIEGQPTEIEKNLNLINTLSEEANQEEYFDDKTLIYPNEILVMNIAKNWSINPTELETYQDVGKELGLVCE